jgi:hypothetical protein
MAETVNIRCRKLYRVAKGWQSRETEVEGLIARSASALLYHCSAEGADQLSLVAENLAMTPVAVEFRKIQ